jgi:hypothetical protein
MNVPGLPLSRIHIRRHIFLLAAFGLISGCANSDFGRVNQILVTDGIHDWIGRDAPPAKSKPSTFEYVDDYNSISFTGSNAENAVPQGQLRKNSSDSDKI